ncbi:MAG: hypothetical protein LC792_06525 [Actinobacteria bacterium]|nr:hypothetical protein [Actinomycetota bacterium]
MPSVLGTRRRHLRIEAGVIYACPTCRVSVDLARATGRCPHPLLPPMVKMRRGGAVRLVGDTREEIRLLAVGWTYDLAKTGCVCWSDAGYCAGDGFDYDDERTCRYCADLDPEESCPADVFSDEAQP